MKDFGERIKALREHKGWSQRQLGEKIHRTKNVVYRIEAGVQTPTIDILIEFAQVFGVSTDFLCGLQKADSLTPEQQELLTLVQRTLENMDQLSVEDKSLRLKEILFSILNEFR